MKLALYVHDFKLEIGHSNSLIELVRHLPEEFASKLEEIEVVAYTSAPLDDIFPQYRGRLRFVQVPFAGMKPVLLKSIFYQLWTWAYHRIAQARGFIRVGIGICCLDVNVVSVQFIHRQWTQRGLELEGGHWLRRAYKFVLFSYFEWCERKLFGKIGLKVFSPAKFLTDFLVQRHPQLRAATIYSGVNLARFQIDGSSKQQLLETLVSSYPALHELDVKRPIYLFVGAYERKGLAEALGVLSQHAPGAQFIVIGSPSAGRKLDWPQNLKVVTIPFTREVPKFYALADVFIFPTMYEPFGLVIFEAMAMGLQLITRRQEVGASELLEGLPEVFFCDSKGFQLPAVTVKDIPSKLALREARLKRLGDVSWGKAGVELARFLDS